MERERDTHTKREEVDRTERRGTSGREERTAWQTRTLQSGLTVENTSPGELFTGPKSPFVRSSSNIHMT